MQFFQTLAAMVASLAVAQATALPARNLNVSEEFAEWNKVELAHYNNQSSLEKRCSCRDCVGFHLLCAPGMCDCYGKFGCWSYDGQAAVCQCGPDGPYSC